MGFPLCYPVVKAMLFYVFLSCLYNWSSGAPLEWVSCIFYISTWMAASDFGDGSIVGSLLHWDRYAFFWDAQLLGCRVRLGLMTNLGLFLTRAWSFWSLRLSFWGFFFVLFLLALIFFPLLYLSSIKGYLFCFSFLHSFFLLYLLFIN